MVALCNRADHYIFALWFYLSSFFFPRLISAVGCLPYFHTSEMCCTQRAENTECKKSPFWHLRTTFSGYILGTKACVNNRKKLVKQQYLLHSPHTCADNMVNFGLLTAEIRWRFGAPLQISTGFV